jgi:ubiquinone/menaquinone biosynthesis C-methylase UbiE
MDHSEVNRQFVDDLLDVCPVLQDVLDVGTGTAQIPVELCRRVDSCRVMAADMSYEMLDLARYNVEVHGLIGRIQLDRSDAKQMLYRDGMFDVVMSNGVLHHIPEPLVVLSEAERVTAPGGFLFFRDLLRPADQETLDQRVDAFAGDASEFQQQMFRCSLHAALNLAEMRALVAQLGFAPESVQATGDWHWTWFAQKPDGA